jgi:polyamine oxidase
VVGAGVSGLAAAQVLQQAGRTVLVLEARQRIGGRIDTNRNTFGVPIELGAQFIHGKQNSRGTLNPIWQIALEQKWQAKSYSKDSGPTHRAGKPLSENDEERFTGMLDRFTRFITEESKSEVANKIAGANKPEDGSPFDVSIEMELQRFLSQRNLKPQQVIDLRAALAANMEEDLAADCDEISVAGYDEDRSFNRGGDQILLQGLDQLPQLLAQGLDVRLGQAVSKIDYSDSVVRVVTQENEFEADQVLVTIPLGVLQAKGVAFHPELPLDKTEAIDRVGMGLLNKVVLQFPQRFWPQGNWLLNIDLEDPYVNSFSSLEGIFPNSNILVVWQYGKIARERENLSDQDWIALVTNQLKTAFGNEAAIQPTSAMVTRWGQDPFSRGSYSFPKVGSSNKDIGLLEQEIDGKIYFAGEATSSHYRGTVHGAFESGLREANKILGR